MVRTVVEPATPEARPETVGESTKGEQTRQLIVDTAVRLFGEQGYDKTTMRAIAGVSVGNAYYYFPSKGHLVQAFYTTVQDAHADACRQALQTPGTFVDRLLVAMRTGVDVMAPYHGFAGSFFKTAAEPGSPLSPFSADSAPARERSVRMFRSVVDGATTKLDPELRADLPELLWLAQMGVTLYWVHDTSPGQAKTRLLVERAVPLIDRLVGMSRFRVFKPVMREVLTLYRLLR
jgi:AcrR family transcriptional regulator